MDITTHRLRSQLISHRTPAAAAAVRHLCAVQAQDYPAALWALGLRTHGANKAAVERAITEHRIVRTWPMRGTLHFVAPEDVRWLLALLAPRIAARFARRYRELELDDATFRKARRIAERELRGTQLTRPTLYQRLEAGGVRIDYSRGLHILGHLARQGVVCFGAREGNQQTLVLLDEWAPGSAELTGDEALAELARRYFTGHGPATEKDLMWWSGVTATEARRGIAAAGDALISESLDGTTYWLSSRRASHDAATGDAYLLPNFDEYVVGYRDRTAIVDPALPDDEEARRNFVFAHTIVVRGRIAGTWTRSRTGAELRAFADLDDHEQQAVLRAAARYKVFTAG